MEVELNADLNSLIPTRQAMKKSKDKVNQNKACCAIFNYACFVVLEPLAGRPPGATTHKTEPQYVHFCHIHALYIFMTFQASFIVINPGKKSFFILLARAKHEEVTIH